MKNGYIVVIFQEKFYGVQIWQENGNFVGIWKKNAFLVGIWEKNGYIVGICQKILAEEASSCKNLPESARFLQNNHPF